MIPLFPRSSDSQEDCEEDDSDLDVDYNPQKDKDQNSSDSEEDANINDLPHLTDVEGSDDDLSVYATVRRNAAAVGAPRPLDGPNAAAVGAPRPLDGPNAAADGAPRPLDGPNAAAGGIPRPLDGPNAAADGIPRPLDGPNAADGIPRPLDHPNAAAADGAPRPLDGPNADDDAHHPLDDPNAAGGIRPTARKHKRTDKPLTRKRIRDPSSWKSSVRKRLRQSGKQYTDSRGKQQAARCVKIKKDCTKCRFKCSANFSEDDRLALFHEFWTLNDNEKRHFFARTTELAPTSRKRTTNVVSRKKNTIRYSLPCNGQNIRVCKTFYLSTVDVSQKRIINYYSSKHEAGDTPNRYQWGTNSNRTVSEEIKNGIRRHISSIPRVESHYCRADTNKEYVAQWGLSVNALYRKYLDKCNEDGTTPGKQYLYRHILDTETNIAFHFPKKDRCDKCEEMKSVSDPSDGEKAAFQAHLQGKEETKLERDRDRANKDAFCVCFDLENVFALPRANISSFFYRRKLNVYNMTAHCSVDKKGYGALWHMGQNGRTGNDIASAVLKLLSVIVEDHANDPRIQHIVMWSDSCVPQNRNSVFSTGLKYFMTLHPEVKVIEQKFCQPGHSSIQEVDNLHSQIEKACGPAEIYSPVGLMRILKTVNKLRMIQLRSDDFKDFQEIAARGRYDRIPYTKVKCLRYEQTDPKVLKYKTKFTEQFKMETVLAVPCTRGSTTKIQPAILNETFRGLKTAKPANELPTAKRNDIKAMLKFMPNNDKAYMSLLVQ